MARKHIVEALEWIATRSNRVPVLWGPTAEGKTWAVHEWARRIGAEVIHLYLAHQDPFEVCGFQLERKDGTLEWALPYWYRKALDLLDKGQKVIIFLDELGQAHEATRGTIYSFLRDGHVADVPLPDRGSRAFLVGATNPFDPEGGLMTRVAFIPVLPDRPYYEEVAGDHDLARLLVDRLSIDSPEVWDSREWSGELPPNPPKLTVADVAAVRDLITPDFWGLDEETRSIVLSAILPAEAVELLKQENDYTAAFEDPAFLFRAWEVYDHDVARMIGLLIRLHNEACRPKYNETQRLRFALSVIRLLACHSLLRETWYDAPYNEGVDRFYSEEVVPSRTLGEALEKARFIYVDDEGQEHGELVEILNGRLMLTVDNIDDPIERLQ